MTIVTVIGGAGVVHALDNPLSPNVVRSDGSFYSTDQIDQVWRSVTANYPKPLPANVAFPVDAPAFFHPENEGKPIFQTGLPELIAARYWRCAWLDASLDGADKANRTSEVAADAELNAYAELPAVKDLVNVSSYELKVSEWAKRLAIAPKAAEFTVECGIYLEEGNVR